METQELLTLKEVAKMLRVSSACIKHWIRTGRIACRYYRVNGGNNYRFTKEEAEKLLVATKEGGK